MPTPTLSSKRLKQLSAQSQQTPPTPDNICSEDSKVTVGDSILARLTSMENYVEELHKRLTDTTHYIVGDEGENDCTASELSTSGGGLLADVDRRLSNLHNRLYKLEDQIRRLESI